MAEYTKKWLSLEDQVAKLASCGLEAGTPSSCRRLLTAVGYYRFTGYLYPLREPEAFVDEDGRHRVQILNRYRAGASVEYAYALIDFDRRLRLLVLDGIERIEISFRMQVGYVLGERSAFAHLDAANFVDSFTAVQVDAKTGESRPSKRQQWIERINARQAESDEAFVAHFRDKCDGERPIWALTEILEL